MASLWDRINFALEIIIMPNLADRLLAAAEDTAQIEVLLTDVLPNVLTNQQRILDAIAAIPGAPDVAEIKADVDELVANLVPTPTV